MQLLITLEELTSYKSRSLVPLECSYCKTTFYRTKNLVQTALRGNCKANRYTYCSSSCSDKAHTKAKQYKCSQCNTEFYRSPCMSTSKNLFCSQSCAGTYNNQHKTHGTRRSKLEAYLESQVKGYYPDLPCLFNNKETIGSELDFYFPTLKLAVELNGIFHYEPIYGQEKFDRIQDNDSQKSIRCYEQGIEFCSIDSSTCTKLTTAAKDRYWNILDNLLKQVIQRNK